MRDHGMFWKFLFKWGASEEFGKWGKEFLSYSKGIQCLNCKNWLGREKETRT